jgi:hypothetical protein
MSLLLKWLDLKFKQIIKRWLTNFKIITERYFKNLSYNDSHKLTNRATPEMYSNHKLSILLFKTFINIEPPSGVDTLKL